MSDPAVVAPLLLAVVLVASGAGKLAAPRQAVEAFETLRIPRSLSKPWVIRLHPWVEILLAILVLSLPGGPGALAASAATLLFVVYTAVVWRALRLPEPVDCACFGSIGSRVISRATIWRNVWFVLLGILTVIVVGSAGSVVRRLADFGSDAWWLIAVLASVVTTGLVLGTGARSSDEVAGTDHDLDTDADMGDYIRARTPAVPVTLADGSVQTLRQLSAERAQLILYVSEGCGGCQAIIAELPQWRERLSTIDIRLMTRASPGGTSVTSKEHPMTLHDPQRWAHDSFGFRVAPSAVLLGVDGLLAGGPARGSAEVADLVEEIAVQLGA